MATRQTDNRGGGPQKKPTDSRTSKTTDERSQKQDANKDQDRNKNMDRR